MRFGRLLPVLGAAAALLSACGGAPSPAPGPVASAPAPRALPAPKEPEAGLPLPPATYDAKQRRDPFAPVVLAEARKGLTVGSAKLAGIIEGRQGPVGLVEAPDGIGYILKVGDTLGDGRVLEIGTDSITFSVAGSPGQKPSTVTLRLKTD